MSESVAIGCPSCRARFKVAVTSLGKRGKCRSCGEVFTLTAAPAPAKPGVAKPAVPRAAVTRPITKPTTATAASRELAAASAPVAKPPQATASPSKAPPMPVEEAPYELSEDDLAGPYALDEVAPPPLAPVRAAPATASTGRFGFGKAKPAATGTKSTRLDGGGNARGQGGTSLLSRIGGGIVMLLVVLGICAKLYKLYRIAGGDTRRPGSSITRTIYETDPAPRTGPFPALGALHFAPEGKYQVARTTISGRHAASTQVRLYVPKGNHAPGSLPCVFVAPAGSNLLVGVPFGDDEHEDFLPMVDAGMAVCFYTLDGTVGDLQNVSEPEFERAAVAYRRSDGGMMNLADAIDVVVASAPMVDPNRLGTSGHSSAGTIALMATAREPRISAAAVVAPAIDVCGRMGQEVLDAIDPQEVRFLHGASPAEITSVSHPIYIYHARDDDNTPAAEASAFAARHGSAVTLELADRGGHVGAYYQGKGKAFAFLAKTLRAAHPDAAVR